MQNQNIYYLLKFEFMVNAKNKDQAFNKAFEILDGNGSFVLNIEEV